MWRGSGIGAVPSGTRWPFVAACDLVNVAIELAKTPSEEPDRDAYVTTALAVLIAAVERGAASSAVLGSLSAVIHDRFPNDPKLTRQLIRSEELDPSHSNVAAPPPDYRSGTT
jgi:hypothetical protein